VAFVAGAFENTSCRALKIVRADADIEYFRHPYRNRSGKVRTLGAEGPPQNGRCQLTARGRWNDGLKLQLGGPPCRRAPSYLS
jgi:hypothetical protein